MMIIVGIWCLDWGLIFEWGIPFCSCDPQDGIEENWGIKNSQECNSKHAEENCDAQSLTHFRACAF